MSNPVHIQNRNLENYDIHQFYHFMIDSRSTNLKEKFGDVKFVIMGGSEGRMKKFAQVLYDRTKGYYFKLFLKHKFEYSMYYSMSFCGVEQTYLVAKNR